MSNKQLLIAMLVSLGACSANDSGNVTALRAAVDDANVKLGATVTVAETTMQSGRALTAELRLAPVEYAVTNALVDLRLDTHDSHILSTAPTSSAATDCPASIPLADAIARAEAKIDGGTVVAAIPDDDIACAREIQVLADLLWEVKVAGDGSILEVEQSDETED